MPLNTNIMDQIKKITFKNLEAYIVKGHYYLKPMSTENWAKKLNINHETAFIVIGEKKYYRVGKAVLNGLGFRIENQNLNQLPTSEDVGKILTIYNDNKNLVMPIYPENMICA